MTVSIIRHMAFALALALGCSREPPPRRRRYVLPPEVDATVGDVTRSARRCALRPTPSEDLGVGAGLSHAVVGWSGSFFGVAWQRVVGDDVAVEFVRASPHGERVGSPARVTDRGFRAGAPSLAWNGASWTILFDGGFRGVTGDVNQARVDARGSPVGLPWRMIRSRRDDNEPALASSGAGFALAWIAREEEGRRHVLYGQVLNRWDAPMSMSLRLIDTSYTLNAPKVTWTGSEWALTCLSSRREVMAVDMVRLDARGLPRGVMQHVSPDRVGGVDVERRYDVAWDGAGFGVVWSELRDGATQVLFRRVSPRGNTLGEDVRVSDLGWPASEPAVVRVADGVFAVAMRVEHDGLSRVWVRTVDADGTAQRSHVELQSADGVATAPAMVFDGRGVGVATVSPRGVSLHLVEVGPCVSP